MPPTLLPVHVPAPAPAHRRAGGALLLVAFLLAAFALAAALDARALPEPPAAVALP